MTDQAQEKKRGQRKVRTGIVVSDCQDKTIVVRVDRRTAHPLYRKVITLAKKYYAHDEANEAKVGDRVEIAETRPLSKTKRWRLTAVLHRATVE
jgi:small subunit ribosomal protein S17